MTLVGIALISGGIGLWLGWAIRDVGARYEKQVGEARARRYREEIVLPEGLRKGIDVLDPSIPPVDRFRPHLDAPEERARRYGRLP